MIYYSESSVINSPIGKLEIVIADNLLVKIGLNSQKQVKLPSSDLGAELVKVLQQYFSNGDVANNIAIKTSGTEFQHRVWQALNEIPKGSVLTYGELAQKLNSSARAVGNACRNNPTPIIVPCHRVVAKQSLGGFAGDTSGKLTDIKRWLLIHEGALDKPLF